MRLVRILLTALEHVVVLMQIAYLEVAIKG